MKKFIPLKPGSTLGICAPSARFDIKKLNLGIDAIKKMGFEIQVPHEIFEKKRYLAGDDILRANVINRLFNDKNIDAIICARGGFGAMRVLEHLDWKSIRQNPKPFIGFSDSTAILLSIMGKTGNMVIHGPNVVSFANARQKTIDSFYNALTGSFDKITITDKNIIKSGKCTGILKGGNIATISHLLGTRFQPDFKNSILFLEDIAEPAYKIDRVLTQMKMASLLDGLQGVITGSFEKCNNAEYIDDILLETFEPFDVPILSGLNCGHGKINLSLCMGAHIEMDTKSGQILWK